LRTLQPVSLLVPSQVADNPTDTVHWGDVASGIFFGDSIEAAQPFGTSETKLLNEGVNHY